MTAEVRALGRLDPLADPSLFRELTQRYLVWDAYVGGERRVDLHPLVLSRALHVAAVAAAEGVVRAVGHACDRAHDDPAERARYDLHPEVLALAAASHEAGDRASLVRVDLLLGEDGAWRACEINADCPGGHNEALGLPRLARAAGFMSGENPTSVVPRAAARLAGLAARDDGSPGAVALLFATAYAEDLQVCAIIKRALDARGVPAILTPPTAPRLRGDRLIVGETEITALYRYFPTEYMEGQRNVRDIARAIRSGRVRSMSAFAHIFLQSKLGMARASALAGELSADDREAIAAHLPDTHDLADVPREVLLADRAGWVVKRALGRVGDEVHVGELESAAEWTVLVDDALAKRRAGESWIAQRFIRQRRLPTPWGPRFVTLGAYVLDGQFVGYFARITEESHVSHDALVVPVFVE
jgi:Glutathionylspermidine synthase preATP-grasp